MKQLRPTPSISRTLSVLQILSSHSSTPEFQRNVTPNGSTFLQNVPFEFFKGLKRFHNS